MAKSKQKKADVITAVLYVVFGLIVAAALFGLFMLGRTLLGSVFGNAYYANLAEDVHSGESVDFTALAAENPQIKAWVTLDDTAIDLPIVQASDNSYYLTHRFDGKKNKLGTPFMDAANIGDFSDRHTVIYGHAVKSGAMFGSFWEYENPNYYKRHPELSLYLPDGSQYTLSVFACSRVDAVRSAVPVSFSSENAFLAYIDELHELSAFTSNVAITADDHIVSFCVCLPNDEEQLLLVSCKLTTPGAATALSDGTSITIGDTDTQTGEESGN
ncbi:MAG TPA: class B sortase [Eubacteriales bacterium]|nr:class B sortase [Eubacteriales bacterium]